MIVFLLSVLLQSLQVILAERFLFHQKVEHVGGAEGLVTDSFSSQVQGENVVQIVIVCLSRNVNDKEVRSGENG